MEFVDGAPRPVTAQAEIKFLGYRINQMLPNEILEQIGHVRLSTMMNQACSCHPGR